jgi:hypothetical protein
MSNLRKFVEAVRTGGRIPRELAAAAAEYIETRLDAASRGGRISRRTPLLSDRKAEQNRERVRRHRSKFKETVSIE